MSFFRIFIMLALVVLHIPSYAQDGGANINITLEIEGEYKFEPFEAPSEGFEGLINTGVLRVISESDTGLAKYKALNDAMQKARSAVWKVVVHGKIDNGVSVRDAIAKAPPYIEYKPKKDEQEAFDALTDEEKDAVIAEKGKEKRYDFEKYLEIIKECGKYSNSGRFYDVVEQKGYACLEVRADDFFAALDNEKINIFKDLEFGDRYRPMDSVRTRYDGIIVDASDTDYSPSLRVKLLSPTEETVYAGIAGRKSVYFAKDLDGAKKVLGTRGVKRVYHTSATDSSGDIGVKLTLPGADSVYSAVSGGKNVPLVIIYKDSTEEITEENILPVGE